MRPKLRAVETTLLEAASSPMVAAIASSEGGDRNNARNEQLEMIFAEIHKQTMANVLLDITGRIGTRQRDASATVPQKNARAATVTTSQVVEDFAKFGK
mgnify:CR=1 FL=1